MAIAIIYHVYVTAKAKTLNEYHEYHIMILCSMNIKISDSAEQCMFFVVNIMFVC